MKTEWLVWVWIVLIMIAGIWALSNGVKLMLNAFYSECQNGAFYTKADCFNDTANNTLCIDRIIKCENHRWVKTNRITGIAFNKGG